MSMALTLLARRLGWVLGAFFLSAARQPLLTHTPPARHSCSMRNAGTHIATLTAATLILAGCSNGGWGLNAVQFNSSAVDHPDDYRARVVDVMARNGIEPKGTRISSPAPIVGAGPWDEQRWYVCVLGVPSEPQAKTWLPADKALASMIDPTSQAGVYNLVFFFSDADRAPTMRTGFDSPLCRDVQFQSLAS
jgi:hypothetical protein